MNQLQRLMPTGYYCCEMCGKVDRVTADDIEREAQSDVPEDERAYICEPCYERVLESEAEGDRQ